MSPKAAPVPKPPCRRLEPAAADTASLAKGRPAAKNTASLAKAAKNTASLDKGPAADTASSASLAKGPAADVSTELASTAAAPR